MQRIIKTEDGYIIESNGERLSVPNDPANRHFHAVQEAIAAGTSVEAEAPPLPDPALSRLQWQYFLRLTGFGAMIDEALAAMPKDTLEQRARWAAAAALAHDAEVYPLSLTLQVKAMLSEMLGVTLPSDDEVRTAFKLAVAFRGAESLLP